MSAHLEATSEVLGEYMLKGWTLTDAVCSNCHATPLMREPAGEARAAGRGESERVEFCGRCQGGPGRALRTINGEAIAAAGEANRADLPAPARIPARVSSRPLMNGHPSSRDITPPDSPPVYQPGSAPTSDPTPRPSGPSQSDLASSRISSLLLRGYALLGETCPTPSCRGIPLVGHPRKRGEQGQAARRECVICGTIYEAGGAVVSRPGTGGAVAGPGLDAALFQTVAVSGSPAGVGAESSREAQRRAMYEQGTRINAAVARGAGARDVVPVALANGTRGNDDTDADADVDMDMDALLADGPAPAGPVTPAAGTAPGSSLPRIHSAIAHSEGILAELLTTLSSSLAAQTRVPGASASRSEVKEHLDRLGEVYALLDKAAGLRERYAAR